MSRNIGNRDGLAVVMIAHGEKGVTDESDGCRVGVR